MRSIDKKMLKYRFIFQLKELIPVGLATLLPRMIGSDHLRAKLYHLAGSNIGANVKIKAGFCLLPIGFSSNLTIGQGTFINSNFRVACGASVVIAEGCSIGPNVSIETSSHSLNVAPHGKRETYFKPVKIQRNVWIGAGAIILPGVTVGEGAVVAAGSVVTKDVEKFSLVAGVPAVILKKIDEV